MYSIIRRMNILSILLLVTFGQQSIPGYPMLDANHVYRPGEQVRVEEPHGVYSGLMSMDGVYFVRPGNVTITRRNKVSNTLSNWDGGLVADIRQATKAGWEKLTFVGGCENIELTAGQIVLGRWDDKGELLIGDHGPICVFKPLDNAAPQPITEAQAESNAVAQLRTINTAEVTYFSTTHGKYGTTQEMISAGLLDRRFAGEIYGYSFEVRVTQGGQNYLISASPVGNVGRYSYTSSADAVIRYGSGPAGTPIGQPVR